MSFKVKVRNKPGPSIVAAQEFAMAKHGQQDHGCLKIGDHLLDVAKHVCLHYDDNVNIGTLEDVVCAAWLHDVVEDTDVCSDEIHEKFGERVGTIVDLVTDKSGRNRLERHLKTYHMIRRDPDALLVKLCDRRHNQERSIKHGEHYAAMYEKEYIYFKFALWTPHLFEGLWGELDSQYVMLRGMLKW